MGSCPGQLPIAGHKRKNRTWESTTPAPGYFPRNTTPYTSPGLDLSLMRRCGGVCVQNRNTQHDPRPPARAPLPPPQDTLSQTPGQYNNQRYRRGEHPPHAVHARVRETTATGENRTPGPHQKEGRTTAAFRKSCPLPPAPGAVFGSNAVTACGKCAITAGVLPAVLETRGEELGREKECDLTTLREQSPRVSMRPGEGVNSSLARVPFRSSGESAETAPAGPGPKQPNTLSQQTECGREQRKIGDRWLRSKIGGRAP